MSQTAAQIWVVLMKAHRALSTVAERSIANTGLCLTDFMVLEALLHKGPLTITEIQSKVLLAAGSMTAAVDRVEKLGYVVRKTTAEDRRARILELTPEGRRVAWEAFRKHVRDLNEVMSVLDETERRQVYEPLKKLGRFAAEKVKKDDSSTQK